MIAQKLNFSGDFLEKIRKRKRLFSELTDDEILQSPVEELRCYFFNVVNDIVIILVDERFRNIPSIISHFKFITNIKTLEKKMN